MKSVYFDDKVINFTEIYPQQAHVISIDTESGELELTKVLQKLEINNTLYVISDHCEEFFDTFVANFKLVEAAGGLVINSLGQTLMIYRNGRWDLPKGHRDNGESLQNCALREIGEECGLHDLDCRSKIADTTHCYQLNGRWMMKRTSWFDVSCKGAPAPVPQHEEGISEVCWMEGEELAMAVNQSYGTIRDVFKVARINKLSNFVDH